MPSEEALVDSLVKVSLQAYQVHWLEPSATNLLVVAMVAVTAEMMEVMRCPRPVNQRMTLRVSSKTISVFLN